jgi:hypothetical protein
MRGLDLRAEAVRGGVPIYRLAAEAGVHPVRLGRMLNERAPLSEQDAERIRAAIGRLAGAAAGR